MFDIGWSEMAVIAVVALIVIGPKDLPRMLRTVGQWVTKARSMAREFQSSIEEMAKEAELDDLKKSVQDVANLDVKGEIEKTIDPGGELQKSFEQAQKDLAQPSFEAPREPLPEPKPEPALPEPVELQKSGTSG